MKRRKYSGSNSLKLSGTYSNNRPKSIRKPSRDLQKWKASYKLRLRKLKSLVKS